MVNKVTLIGRLGRDPEVRHLESGATVAKFSIATSEYYKDKTGQRQERTEWHDIIMWRGLAETAERLLTKGKPIYIEGRLTHRKWEDKDGNPRKTTEVVANTFQILERKEEGGAPSSSGNDVNSFPKADEPQKVGYKQALDKEIPDAPDDDLPF